MLSRRSSSHSFLRPEGESEGFEHFCDVLLSDSLEGSRSPWSSPLSFFLPPGDISASISAVRHRLLRFFSDSFGVRSPRISLLFVSVVFLAIAAASSAFVWNYIGKNQPYLCTRDKLRALRCLHVKDPPLLWENPYPAATSWKSCVEHRIIDTSCNRILIAAEGGLNQQRVSLLLLVTVAAFYGFLHICNAVAVAKIMNASLILPVLRQDQIWNDSTTFEDIYDADHFISFLRDDVQIIRNIPKWFGHKNKLLRNIRWLVKDIPKYASSQFYIDNVLPRIKEEKLVVLKPFTDRLGYDNVSPEINKLRCRVNYHALKFLPKIEEMGGVLASRMRKLTGRVKPFIALHLRYEKGMVGLSFCDFVGTREEKLLMDEYKRRKWPSWYNNGFNLWEVALEKRKAGWCPLEPGEIAMVLRALGYKRDTQIYVASGVVYGGENKMAPLRNMFPNLATKEDLATKEELDVFGKHVMSLAALDFLMCIKSDVFVMTHGSNFVKLVIGARRYMGHRLKSIKPVKGHLFKIFGDPYMGWAPFMCDVMKKHQYCTGLPEETFPFYDIWENPLTPCMCRG